MSDEKEIANEIHALRELRHPNIMAIHDVISTAKAVVLVLELLNGGKCWGNPIRSSPLHM